MGGGDMYRQVRMAGALVAAAALGMSPVALQAAWAAAPFESANANDQNYITHAAPVASHLAEATSGNLMRVEFDQAAACLRIEEYSDDGAVLSQHALDALDLAPAGTRVAADVLWGGFYAGHDSYYTVCGQDNPDERDDVAVVRVCKFDTDWSLVDTLDIAGINTRQPFRAGSLRMLEVGGALYIRTSHVMYASDDGPNHQSNMTLVVDEATMQLVDGYWDVMNVAVPFGYVSHSFNQFVCELDGEVYALDHGDAYPRSVVLKHLGAQGLDSYAELPDITGETGDNNTGVALGGLESSEAAGTLLAVGTSAPQDGSVRPGAGARDAWLSVTSADLAETQFIWLTDFGPTSSVEATVPRLVKVNENRFMIAWGTSADELSYVFVDGTGKMLTDTKIAAGALSDCQPIVHDGQIVWYTTGNAAPAAPVFYRIDPVTGALATVDTALPLAVTGIEPAYVYTGAPLEPAPTVTRDGVVLKEGTDYTVTYEDNLNVGRAQVTVTPTDGDEPVVLHFTIQPASLEDAQISVPEVHYTGSPLEPAPSVSFGGAALVEGLDYVIVAYEDNTQVGTGSVRLRGTGNFTDTVEVPFAIVEEPSDYGFPDVTPGDWYATRDVLGYALSHRLMNGYDNGLFGPYDFITRGQVACILYNMAGQPAATSPDFADVDYGEYYGGAIRWARAHGVVNGYGDNTFAPERIVSRQELCAMLANYAEKIGGMTIESDCTALDAISGADQVAGWARTVVGWAVDYAIISGEVVDGVAQVNPEGGAWRASAAKMVSVLHRDVL